MTAEKVRSVVELYERELGLHIGERWGDQELGDPNLPLCRLCHAKWMVLEMKKFLDDGQIEKAFRWLGFVQGILWCEGVYTIDEMEDHNLTGGQDVQSQ